MAERVLPGAAALFGMLVLALLLGAWLAARLLALVARGMLRPLRPPRPLLPAASVRRWKRS